MILYHPKTNQEVLNVDVDDNSYRHRAIMGEDTLTLYFSLSTYTLIPVGAYCYWLGDSAQTKYTLLRPAVLKKQHEGLYEYTLTLDAEQGEMKLWKFRNTVDGRLKFSLTAKPQEHLEMLCTNLNDRVNRGWTVGACIESAEKLVNYDHAYCWDALGQIASAFDTEFYINPSTHTISLGKVEFNKDSPLKNPKGDKPLSYGFGNGFKPNVGRSNYGDNPPIENLYVQGGSDNITMSGDNAYDSRELHMPKSSTLWYDGTTFYDFRSQLPTDPTALAKVRCYVTDSKGLYVHRDLEEKPYETFAEDSLDCSSIYPKHIGEISSVVTVDASKNFYDIVDTSIPNGLDYSQCMIEGTEMTIIFQSGMLAGREFNVKYYHTSTVVNGVTKAAKRFEIVPQEIDDIVMPNETFIPKAQDKYIVFHTSLPQSYINDYPKGGTKTGAEWEMMREAVKYLYEHEELQYTFSGQLDGIWAKDNWTDIGGKIRLGGYVTFKDDKFQSEPMNVRIIGIKDYVNEPKSPEIELSNTTVTPSFTTTLQNLKSEDVAIKDGKSAAIQYTKRSWRQTMEAMDMLQDAVEGFDPEISPIAIKSMMAVFGSEALQFRFLSNSTGAECDFPYSYSTTKELNISPVTIEHMTIGVTSLSNQHTTSERRRWSMSSYTSAALTESDKKYYLYAVVSKSGSTGYFTLSDNTKQFDDSGVYNLLVGILSSEDGGTRSFTQLYGFTEILPGRVITDKVVSGNGNSYFDMKNNKFALGDKLSFNANGDGQLILKGTLVQNNPNAEPSAIGVYRGGYYDSVTYYKGDEVSYTNSNGEVCTYRCITSASSVSGVAPEGSGGSSSTWQVVARGAQGQQGQKGDDGEDGEDGKSVNPNLLYQTDFKSDGEMKEWSLRGGSIGTDKYNGYNMYICYNSDSSTYKDMLRQPLRDSGKEKIEAGKWYTLSFYAKKAYSHVDQLQTIFYRDIIDVSSGSKVYVDGVEKTPNYTQDWAVTQSWQKHTYTFKAASSFNSYEKTFFVRLKAKSSNTSTANNYFICMVKLEEGQGASAYIPHTKDLEAVYYEYRYASSNSDTYPALSDARRDLDNPEYTSGGTSYWTVTLPDTTYTNTWQIVARKDGYGHIIERWSLPVKMNGSKGEDGKSPAMVYRGEYDSSKTYYGNDNRLDCVKYGSAYYVAKIDAGTFSSYTPSTSSAKWNSFGASFESVATGLLLAEQANVAGFVFKGNKMISQMGKVDGEASYDFGNANFVPNLTVDGFNGVIRSSSGAEMDSEGITLYNSSNQEIAKFVSTSIGSEADLGSGTWVNTILEQNVTSNKTLQLSGGAYSQTTWFEKDYSLGYLSSGSQIMFGVHKGVLTLPNVDGVDFVFINVSFGAQLYRGSTLVSTSFQDMYNSCYAGQSNELKHNTSAIGVSNLTAGTYKLKTYIKVTMEVSGSTNQVVMNGISYNENIAFMKKTTALYKTLIGSDGMFSAWGANKYFFGSSEGCTIRQGNYILKVTSSGIQKSTNGGSSYTNL